MYIILTSRSTRPTDVLWVVAIWSGPTASKRVLPCHAFLDGPKSLRHISEFSLDNCLLNAKA